MRHFEGHVGAGWLLFDYSGGYLLSTEFVVYHLFGHNGQRWLTTDLAIVKEPKIIIKRVLPLFNWRHWVRLNLRSVTPLLNTGFVFLFEIVSLLNILDGLGQRIMFDCYSLVIIR